MHTRTGKSDRVLPSFFSKREMQGDNEVKSRGGSGSARRSLVSERELVLIGRGV
jgi:hypothetical protein